MEVSGVLFQSPQSITGAGLDSHPSKICFSSLSVGAGKRLSGELRIVGSRDSTISLRPRKPLGSSSSGFSDNGHLQYYVSPRCARNKREKVKKKEKDSEMATIKRKLKLIKGLSKNLSMFSQMDFLEFGDDSVKGDERKKISDAAEVLMAQLEHLRTEEEELKSKKKEEKARMKAAAGMEVRGKSESSSSSSSESSDSDCGQVVSMSSLRKRTQSEPQITIQTEKPIISLDLPIQEQRTMDGNNGVESLSSGEAWCSSKTGSLNSSGCRDNGSRAEKIEVCMGSKCKKSGAGAVLEEFERRIDVEGAVVGCKCMGKCRNGPNVRVFSSYCSSVKYTNTSDDVSVSVTTPANHPLCLGVGIEDVDVILANFLISDGSSSLNVLSASSVF
ncbi:PREDICTED: uncharacterized protein LOC104607168 [Nelumbo nucifera]|uniref:Diacylglycerol O-acyltransferase 3, cytosolic n=2 Tax=Nelumbo nucifera TaxID=4432 RepID=A0A822Z1S4_NELNU|nr:PREDICTED: uncharacterized protein LOC104607168 [Nelumbo nucifera]DAD38463.1 TPA_asm: hypothetical protein HUJ06_009104 [Nelumbo nucifera]